MSDKIQRPPSQRLRRAKVIAALVTVVTLCATATPHPAAATRNFIWKATSSKGAVYLVGSVHLLTKDYYPLSPALDTAFKESDLLVEELDLGEMAQPQSQMQFLMKGMLPPGQTLDKIVSPGTFTLVTKRLESLGMPVEPMKQFKPWSLALTLLSLEWVKAGFDAELGLDKHFYDRAKTEGKTIRAFETLEFQISRFDGMSMAQQDRLLVSTLSELDNEIASITKLTTAWKEGDVQTMERLSLDEFQREKEMYERLLVERNRNWLPTIETFFARPKPAFIVVGAAHLIGPDGLIAMLKAKGYKVEQL